ncbi:SMP-30/gluconolactonase/LRE family protein [Novosphingobium sp. fls2-241-R2A-195]|jgi:gluconolactonase|uniref:SMP-30/gluconolactonase/LRE family protein n=1 Tax=Novosphingobium sp. fls2-241-R2A-195 TaxID=3040296 RepID=UPI00254E5892|nr:SMP-30/gluconolactonase/LRE family protein [Novosphingobium sp. fls2-241-R2A-195]
MFAAPPAVTAEVFCRIPDKFRRFGESTQWAQVQLHGAAAPVFLEGPVFDAAGNLWVTDIPWGRLFRISPDGECEVGFEYDGQPNGMKFLSDGRLLVADHHKGMVICDPASGKAETWFDRYLLEPFLGCNDLTIAKNGDIWFTDQGQSGWQNPNGRLFRVRAGTGRLELMLDGIPSPNGLVLNKAGTALYLAVTRANAVWRCPLVNATGNEGGEVISKVGTYIQLSGGSGPDGLTIDENDNLVVCHVGFGAVWLFSDRGEPMLRIDVPEGRYTTNAAYGGPGNRWLFFTESSTGTVYKVEMPVAGREIYEATI